MFSPVAEMESRFHELRAADSAAGTIWSHLLCPLCPWLFDPTVAGFRSNERDHMALITEHIIYFFSPLQKNKIAGPRDREGLGARQKLCKF